MKSRTSVWRGLAFTALGALTFAACDEKEPTDVITPDPVVVSVTPTSLSLATGQTGNAIAVVTNATTNQTINWRSANPAVATVSPATGGQVTITAVGVGNTVITAISAQDTTARAAVAVTVTASPVVITMSPPEAGITVGQTVQMVAQVTGTTNTAVTYRTSAATVASVSATGLVTGVAAGTAVITAVATADTTKRATSVITVSAQSPVQITLTPVTAAVTVGQTVQFVATVTGATNTAVIWRTSAPTIATVSTTGLATGVAAGTAVISAISAADTTRRQTATLTVNPRPPEASISIQSVTVGNTLTPVNPGAVAGLINVRVNISAVPENQVQRAAIIIDGTEICAQVYTPVLGTTQSVATIDCPVNTAALNAQGQPVFPNGPHTLRAVAFRTNGDTAATATYPTLTFANANVATANVTFTASALGTDGFSWSRGDITVAVGPGTGPAIFTTGVTLASVPVILDLNCDGITDATLNANTSNSFTVTFTEGTATAQGILWDFSGLVCIRLGGVTTTAGQSLTVTPGTGFSTLVAPNAEFPLRHDNLEPTANPVFPDPFPGTNDPVENWLGAGFVFSFARPTSSPAVIAAAVITGVTDQNCPLCSGVFDSGVTFHAVPVAQLPAGATQAELAAAVAANPAVTGASQIPNSTTDEAYYLVVRVRDAVGNQVYFQGPLFGVDTEVPALNVLSGSPLDKHINPQINPSGNRIGGGAPVAYTFSFVDTHSDFPSIDAPGGRSAVQVRLARRYGAGPVTCYNVNTKALIAAGDVLVGGTLATAADAQQTAGACQWVAFTASLAYTFDMTGLPEGYWEVQIRAVDRAGNPSLVATRVHLIDVTAPTASILSITFAPTFSLTAGAADSVDLRQGAPVSQFGGLPAVVNATPSPMAIAVTSIPVPAAPQPLGAFGFADGLARSASFTLTTTGLWRAVQDGAGGVIYNITSVGVGVFDIARNYGEILGTAPTLTPGDGAYDALGGTGANNAAALASFVLTTSGATISNGISPQGGADWGASISNISSSRTLTATATGVANTFRRPFTVIHFYRQDAFGHIYWIGSSTAPTVTFPGGVAVYTYTFTLSVAGVPGDAAQEVFAIGVDIDGDALRSNVVTQDIRGAFQTLN